MYLRKLNINILRRTPLLDSYTTLWSRSLQICFLHSLENKSFPSCKFPSAEKSSSSRNVGVMNRSQYSCRFSDFPMSCINWVDISDEEVSACVPFVHRIASETDLPLNSCRLYRLQSRTYSIFPIITHGIL
jgi:hypothetical protein